VTTEESPASATTSPPTTPKTSASSPSTTTSYSSSTTTSETTSSTVNTITTTTTVSPAPVCTPRSMIPSAGNVMHSYTVSVCEQPATMLMIFARLITTPAAVERVRCMRRPHKYAPLRPIAARPSIPLIVSRSISQSTSDTYFRCSMDMGGERRRRINLSLASTGDLCFEHHGEAGLDFRCCIDWAAKITEPTSCTYQSC